MGLMFHTKVIDAPSSRYQVSTSAIKTRLVLTYCFFPLVVVVVVAAAAAAAAGVVVVVVVVVVVLVVVSDIEVRYGQGL